jgi:hypothetical protein
MWHEPVDSPSSSATFRTVIRLFPRTLFSPGQSEVQIL